MQDRDLLREYVLNRSEAAFAELVARHINLVFAAARRAVGDEHLAKDVTQNTFIHLARHAGEVRNGDAVGGWLYRIACNLAASAVRSEVRRRAREHTAMSLAELHAPDASAWTAVAPLLEEAMQRLNADEQDAVLLRFFEGKSLREVGVALELSDDAAQKRVSRALDKMRAHFARQGVTATAALLATLLATHSASAAPASLAPSVAGVALAQAPLGAAAVAAGKWLGPKGLSLIILGAMAVAVVAGWQIHAALAVHASPDQKLPVSATVPEGVGEGQPGVLTLESPLNPGAEGAPSQFTLSSLRANKGETAIVRGEGTVSPVLTVSSFNGGELDASPVIRAYVLQYRISWQVFKAPTAEQPTVSSTDDFEIHSSATLRPNVPFQLMRVNGKSVTLLTDGKKIVLTITRGSF